MVVDFVLSCPCANYLGLRWLAQFDFFYALLTPGLPKKKLGFFLTHLSASTPHLPTHLPQPFFLPTFSLTYFKWPSFIPTYLHAHPSTYQVAFIYLPTHLSLGTYQLTSYTPHKHEEMLMKPNLGIAIHVAPPNDEIRWRYCISSCKWLFCPFTFIPISHPNRYLLDTT
jgi:hypothetical protein